MDKMTDGRIRAWLQKNNARILDQYNAYLDDLLENAAADQTTESDFDPIPLRSWLEENHPALLDQVSMG